MQSIRPDPRAPFFIVLNAGSGSSETQVRRSVIEDVLTQAGRHFELMLVDDPENIAAIAARAASKAKEAGGILVESSTRPGGGMSAVIGVGLNLVSRPAALGAAATSLAGVSSEVAKARAAGAVFAGLPRRYDALRALARTVAMISAMSMP